jgi:hypothetical protein
MEQTRIYPLGKEAQAKPMQFPDASGVSVNMLPPRDFSAFDMLKRFIDADYVDPADMNMRGMLEAIGIVKDQPFAPDARAREVLDKAAKRAAEMGRYIAIVATPERPGAKFYADRQYINAFPPVPGTPDFTAPSYTDIDLRAGYFTIAYSTSPGMALSLPDVGAKYPFTFKDANGDYLSGDRSYRMNLPVGIPAKLFWSVTVTTLKRHRASIMGSRSRQSIKWTSRRPMPTARRTFTSARNHQAKARTGWPLSRAKASSWSCGSMGRRRLSMTRAGSPATSSSLAVVEG